MVQALYSVKDYRKYLQSRISEGEWGTISRMAEATGCQRSQLSRVAGGHLHLTTDQAFALTEFWGFDQAETDYFLKLVESARTGNKRYRERLERELEGARREQEDIAKRLQQPKLAGSEVEAYYYSSWYWSAVHIATSIPHLQSAKAISEKLSIPSEQVEFCLKQLESWGMVRRDGTRFRFASHSVHSPKSSPYTSIHHSNWRQRAVTDSYSLSSEGVHYTVVQSVSRADVEIIKHHLLKFIEDYSRVAAPSKEEELVCLTCDFFKP